MEARRVTFDLAGPFRDISPYEGNRPATVSGWIRRGSKGESPREPNIVPSIGWRPRKRFLGANPPCREREKRENSQRFRLRWEHPALTQDGGLPLVVWLPRLHRCRQHSIP